ncbi:MAG: hypothetical protein IJ532_04725 [Alphaproteobacteria bacterium]|nr:hypothetical protein [Alphaproteobacteria bacterium]
MSDDTKNTVTEGIDDFETLLNSFINTKIEDFNDDEGDDKKKEDKPASSIIDETHLSEQGQKENEEASRLFEEELASTFAEARTAIEEEENKPTLGSDESELAQAFVNYQASVQKLSQTYLNRDFECTFKIDDLYPNYKPSLGSYISADLINGWMILSEIFPNDVGQFPVSSTDEEFLNFAETLKNQDLQLAVISYVEILIDMESCELTYLAKLAKYQEKHIKKIMYEEYLARKERQQKFTDAVKKKNFPIDAERLISNYFRVAQKDIDGAYKALTTNPAIFAPIDFGKIKPRFFGLVKVSPKDGIRINIEIGNFMKKLKA